MTVNINKVILAGTLGKDPELKYTTGGKAVASFSMATNDGFGDKKTTTWHNISAWGKTAENIKNYLTKGSNVYLEGRITTESWNNKEGVKVYKTVIVCDNIQFLDSKVEGTETFTSNGKKKQKEEVDDNTIPF
jgi:single-strand DNA-binding protein